jgi:hypothetical protein
MQQKHLFGLWGIGVGAAALLAIEFSAGWVVTKSTANDMASQATSGLLVKMCVEDMLSNESSVALLKTKKPIDYDDAVRDAWRPVGLPQGIKVPNDFSFRRECGKAIEARMAPVTKS